MITCNLHKPRDGIVVSLSDEEPEAQCQAAESGSEPRPSGLKARAICHCESPLSKGRNHPVRLTHLSLCPSLSRFSVKRSPTSPPGTDKICTSGIFSAHCHHPAPRLHLLLPSRQPWRPLHGLSVLTLACCLPILYRATERPLRNRFRAVPQIIMRSSNSTARHIPHRIESRVLSGLFAHTSS